MTYRSLSTRLRKANIEKLPPRSESPKTNLELGKKYHRPNANGPLMSSTKLSNTDLAIAKASLLASLLKSDAGLALASCPRDTIDHFLGFVQAVTEQCTPSTVQSCKQWFLQHVHRSPTRAKAFGRYLVAFSSLLPESAKPTTSILPSTTKVKSSLRQKRLYLLYLINDILYHIQTHKLDTETHQIALLLEDCIVSCVTLAAEACLPTKPHHRSQLEDLVTIWREKEYFHQDVLRKLSDIALHHEKHVDRQHETTSTVSLSSNDLSQTATSSKSDSPMMIPAQHGDQSAAWYDLPAATWIPYLGVLSASSTASLPLARGEDVIKPLHFQPGPAPLKLASAVQSLLEEVDSLFQSTRTIGLSEAEASKADDGKPLEQSQAAVLAVGVNELGETVRRGTTHTPTSEEDQEEGMYLDEEDSMAGTVLEGDTYYGWSRSFSEKMQRHQQQIQEGQQPLLSTLFPEIQPKVPHATGHPVPLYHGVHYPPSQQYSPFVQQAHTPPPYGPQTPFYAAQHAQNSHFAKRQRRYPPWQS